LFSTWKQKAYRFYWRLEQLVVPGLRSSQYAYYETLRRYLSGRPLWLDLGCGHHVFGPWMQREEAECLRRARHVYGLDCDLPSLRKHTALRDKFAADLEYIPVHSGLFDVVTANMVIEHLRNPSVVLDEVWRILKPSGVFICHTPNFLGYPTLLASMLPGWIKTGLVRVLEGRRQEDLFPTHYRLNTPGALRRHGERASLNVTDLSLVNTSAATAMLGPVVLPELLFIRMLRAERFRALRTNIIAVFEKLEAAAERAA
jgi:SAM-dependent methyltransferase